MLSLISLDMLSVICSAEDNHLANIKNPMPVVDTSIANMNTIVIILMIEMFLLLAFKSVTILFSLRTAKA